MTGRAPAMLRRPLILWLFGLGLLLAPLFYYFEPVVIAGAPWDRPLDVVARIPATKLGAAVLAPLVAVALLSVRPAGWYAVLGYGVYIVFANVALYVRGDIRPTLFALFVPTGLIAIAVLVRREVLSPFFNPRLRGWETDRVRCERPVEVRVDGAPPIKGRTWDISPTGVFLEMDPLTEGTSFELALELEPGAPLVVNAVAVWSAATASEARPRGVGARFANGDLERVASALPRALRRSEARLPFKLQVDIAGRQGVSCETFDLSPHGCFLVTDAKFSIGEVLRLTLHVDGPVEVEGTVVRVSEQPMGIGIRFATSPRRLALALRDFHAVAAAA